MIFLSQRDQNIIRLRYGENKSIREIAREINISPSYVRKLIKKSLMRMMSSIEETEEMEKIYSKIGESNIFNLTMSLNSVDYMSSMIIKLHYGLLGGKSIPIRKISSILGLSREKVTKLEKKGLLFLCDQVLTNSNSK